MKPLTFDTPEIADEVSKLKTLSTIGEGRPITEYRTPSLADMIGNKLIEVETKRDVFVWTCRVISEALYAVMVPSYVPTASRMPPLP